MLESSNPFTEIFKRLTAEEFIEDPTRILSLMMDFGFDSRHVKILRVAMSEDMKEVREFLECTVDSENEIIGNISEYCLVSQKALTDMLGGIKSSMYRGVETRIIDDEKYGRCRISADGIAKYSLDMTMLHRVTDVNTFTIPDTVTVIQVSAFAGHTSLKEVVIPDSVTAICPHAFDGCIHASFKVNTGNGCYSSDSGALFNKDKSVLLTGYSLVHNGKCMIPGCVKEIGDWAFFCCSSLCKVIISDSVTEIGYSAFDSCESLCEVRAC